MQRETGRIYSICYSEHFATRCTVKAGEFVAAGAIGCVIDDKVLTMPQSGDAERRAFARDSGADDQCDTVVFGIPAHTSDDVSPSGTRSAKGLVFTSMRPRASGSGHALPGCAPKRRKAYAAEEVGDELPLARQQPAVFAPQQRPADIRGANELGQMRPMWRWMIDEISFVGLVPSTQEI